MTLLAFAVALTPSNVLAGPDCTCRYNGGDIPQGQTACLKTPNGTSLARCEMVLNNTSWTILNQPCPTASLSLSEPGGFATVVSGG